MCHESIRVRADIAPLVVQLGTREGKWSPSHPGSFYPQGKSPLYQLNKGLNGFHSQYGYSAEEKNLSFLTGIELQLPGHLTHRSLVTKLITLSQLQVLLMEYIN